MRISAKADYAVRAAAELAAAGHGVLVKADVIAQAADIPRQFLDNPRPYLPLEQEVVLAIRQLLMGEDPPNANHRFDFRPAIVGFFPPRP